jgi:phospholipid/cholesterol/gamma-HCH transport system substrate-binding protein
MTPTAPASLPLQAPADRERHTALRAGAFVLGTILAVGLVLVILGNAHRIFERHTSYVVYFEDVDGLMVDSPVRLGGLAVGNVEAITFSHDLKDTRVLVKLRVSSEFTSRVRGDSLARVASRGLLGDKTVDLSLGSEGGKPVENGGELTAGAGNDIASVLKSGTQVVNDVKAISSDVRRAIAIYTSPAVSDELTGSLTVLHGILDEVATGNGALHAVIYDPKTGDEVKALVASASQVARRLDGAVTQVQGMLEEVRRGSGTAHALIYGSEGKAAFSALADAATEVGALVHDVKASKNSAVHALLLGDSKDVVDDLAAAAKHLEALTARIDRGEGSLGALVNDPTAYEDLKTILGNVQRNKLLRELVRMTISNRSEYARTGETTTVVKPEGISR